MTRNVYCALAAWAVALTLFVAAGCAVDQAAQPPPPQAEQRPDLPRGTQQVWAAGELDLRGTAAAEKALAQSGFNLKVKNAPLADVIDTLREGIGASIHVKWKVLALSGCDGKTPVTLDLSNVTAARALRTVLEEVRGEATPLDYEVHEGVVTVSTYDDLSRYTVTRVYDIRDLIADAREYDWRVHYVPPRAMTQAEAEAEEAQAGEPGGLFGPAGAAVGSAGALSHEERVDCILELIRGSIAPETWRGGETPGMIGSARELNGKLIITHTPSVHRRVHRLLEALRERGPAVPPAAPHVLRTKPHKPKPATRE